MVNKDQLTYIVNATARHPFKGRNVKGRLAYQELAP
jgi:hypothetical protein